MDGLSDAVADVGAVSAIGVLVFELNSRWPVRSTTLGSSSGGYGAGWASRSSITRFSEFLLYTVERASRNRGKWTGQS